MMATKNIKMQPARLAVYITFALTHAVSVAHARETFNAELVELDNSGMAKADLSAFESGSQAPGNTMLISFLTTSLLRRAILILLQ